MRIRRLLAALALIAAHAAACEDEDDEDAESSEGADHCDAPDAPGYADVAIFDTCTMCHASTLVGPDRNGALASVNFDTYEAAADAAAPGLERVQAGAMPPPGSGLTVTQAEVDELERWVHCGTPQ
jgi:uncharacterized membrane protein